MKNALLAVVVLAACQSSVDDYPPRPGNGGPTQVGEGSSGDAGTGDGGVGITGRLCILRDLRKVADCDATKDASRLSVTLGTKRPSSAPTKVGVFTIPDQLGTGLVWRVTGATIVPTVMPFGTDTVIPVVPDDLYNDLLVSNRMTIPAEGQGSVVVRVVRGAAPAAGVAATSTLVSANVVPLYDADNSALDWRQIGPTQGAGIVWFPGVNVTTTPARITLTPMVGAAVTLSTSVETGAITFVTQDLQ